MSIDLTLNPEDLAQRIVDVACEHREPWIDETVKNFRRLAAFTEKDVPTETINSTSIPVAEVEPAAHRYATSFNITRNFFSRLLGRIMPALVQYQVLAASRDRSDRDAAQIAARYLRSRTSPDSGQDFESVIRAVSYLFAGGPAYYRVEATYTDDGYGDVDTDAVPGFDVYTFPGILELNESPAIVVEERLTKLVIERRWPDLAKRINWTGVPGAKWPKDVSLETLSPKIDEGCYTVRRLMVRPIAEEPTLKEDDDRSDTPAHAPNGREFIMIVGAPGIVEDRDKLDTADGMYPLVTVSDIPMGPFYEDRGRMSISSRMQKTIDICISKMLDVVIGGPQLIVGLPASGALTREDFTNQTWLFYDKVPGQELDIQETGGLGNLSQVIEMAMHFMGEVHAQHEPSRGQSPGARMSGKALEHMTSMDVAVDEPFLAMIRRALGRIGKRILMEAKRVLAPNHPFVSMSKNQRHQMESFRKSDLKAGFDVRVMPGKGLPDNKAARLQLVIKGLGQIPLFSDDPAAIRARNLLDMRIDDDEDYEFQDEEEQIIRDEDILIEKLMVPEVSFSDTHALHRKRHKQANNRRRSEKKSSPEIEAVAAAHFQAHMKMEQRELEAMMPPVPPEQPKQTG